jgi:cytochrome c553
MPSSTGGRLVPGQCSVPAFDGLILIYIKALQPRCCTFMVILRKFVVTFVTGSRLRLISALAVAVVFQSGSSAVADEKQNFRSDLLYRSACAPCHGQTGAGDGPVASVIKGGVPRLDDLTKRYSEEFPADYVRQTIDGRLDLVPHGTPDMPVWGLRFSLRNDTGGLTGKQADASGEAAADMLVDALVRYVASLQAQ